MNMGAEKRYLFPVVAITFGALLLQATVFSAQSTTAQTLSPTPTDGVIQIIIPTVTPPPTSTPISLPPPPPQDQPTPEPTVEATQPRPTNTPSLPIIDVPIFVPTQEVPRVQPTSAIEAIEPTPPITPTPFVLPTVVVNFVVPTAPPLPRRVAVDVEGRVCLTEKNICDELSEAVPDAMVFYIAPDGKPAFVNTDRDGFFKLSAAENSLLTLFVTEDYQGEKIKPVAPKVDFPLRRGAVISTPGQSVVPVVIQSGQSALSLLLMGLIVLLLFVLIRQSHKTTNAVRSLSFLAYRLAFKPTTEDEATILREIKQLLSGQGIDLPGEVSVSVLEVDPSSPLFMFSGENEHLLIGAEKSLSDFLARQKIKARLEVLDASVSMPMGDLLFGLLKSRQIVSHFTVDRWYFVRLRQKNIGVSPFASFLFLILSAVVLSACMSRPTPTTDELIPLDEAPQTTAARGDRERSPTPLSISISEESVSEEESERTDAFCSRYLPAAFDGSFSYVPTAGVGVTRTLSHVGSEKKIAFDFDTWQWHYRCSPEGIALHRFVVDSEAIKGAFSVNGLLVDRKAEKWSWTGESEDGSISLLVRCRRGGDEDFRDVDAFDVVQCTYDFVKPDGDSVRKSIAFAFAEEQGIVAVKEDGRLLLRDKPNADVPRALPERAAEPPPAPDVTREKTKSVVAADDFYDLMQSAELGFFTLRGVRLPYPNPDTSEIVRMSESVMQINLAGNTPQRIRRLYYVVQEIDERNESTDESALVDMAHGVFVDKFKENGFLVADDRRDGGKNIRFTTFRLIADDRRNQTEVTGATLFLKKKDKRFIVTVAAAQYIQSDENLPARTPDVVAYLIERIPR